VGALFLFISLPLAIFAKLRLPFAQPWASYKNHKAMVLKQKIFDADRDYCETHDCSDATLMEEFKYDEYATAIYSEYVEKMNKERKQTDHTLQDYYQIVANNIVYLPPRQTNDIYHLLRVYTAILDGVPTWDKAIRQVDHDERMHHMEKTLSAAIKNSTSEIVQSIDRAQSEISQQLTYTNSRLNDLVDEARHQTNAINYWGTAQVAMTAYQTDLMRRTNSRINSR